jgi:regulatory protein
MPDRIVELKSRPRERVLVTLAGGRFFTIPAPQAYALSVGLEISDEEIARLDQMDQYFRGREKALRLLSLRHRTRHEVKTALDRMSVNPAIREGILSELEEEGLVDDARFAREFAQTKAESRFMGPHRLRHDLSRLGVRRDVVDAAMEETFSGERQEAQAWALVERRLGASTPDERDVRRLAGLLRRKGYDYEVVNRVSYELLRRSGGERAMEE